MNRSTAQACGKSIPTEEELSSGNTQTLSTILTTNNICSPTEIVSNFQLSGIDPSVDDEPTDGDNEEDDDLNMLKYDKKNNNQNYNMPTNYNYQQYYAEQRVTGTKHFIPVQSSNYSKYNSQHTQHEMLMGPPPSTTTLGYNFEYPVQAAPPRRSLLPPCGNMHAIPYQSYPPIIPNTDYTLPVYNQHTTTQTMQQQNMKYGNDNSLSYYQQQQQQQQQQKQQQMLPQQPQTGGAIGSFHNKMWYPNAPYARNETAASSSRAYSSSSTRHNLHYNVPAAYTHTDPMMDMLQLSNSGREARNRAEKNRRDKLNSYIQDLSGMVPHVAESPRRVDKTAVLRFAVHGLRLNHVFNAALNQPEPHGRNVTDAFMQLMDSFFLTMTCRGEILLISSSVEKHLGHCQTDLYGQNILHITHPEDHNIIKQQLIPTDIEKLFQTEAESDMSDGNERTKEEEKEIDRRLRNDRRSFTVRLARAGPRSEPTVYEVVKIDGNFRCSDRAPRGGKANKLSTSLHMLRRSRTREDPLPLHNFSANDIVLIAIARVIHPPKIVNCVMEANKLEYKTRHLIDGRIIDCDQRISLVTGYMKDEVRNLSPFSFMHQDDARWVIVALRQMYDHHSSYGESTHRLLTRSGHFVYLQTKGYLEIDKHSNKVHSFVCVNTLLSDEEGRLQLQEMKKKFSIIINAHIPQSSIDVPASENPQLLEKAVMCLIQNLHKSATDDTEDDELEEELSKSPVSADTEATMPRDSCASSHSAKTPPLALVPPETESVKDSLSKSVTMVSVAAAKLVRDHPRVIKSPQTTLSGDSGDEASRYDSDYSTGSIYCTCLTAGGTCEYCLNVKKQQSVSGSLKRGSSVSSDNEDVKLPKFRLKSTEIEHVLTSSLDHIGRSLNRQINAAMELQGQGIKYEIPNSQQRINEIMEEHQKQSELYVNIKTEYEVQLHNTAIDIDTTNVKLDSTTPSPPPPSPQTPIPPA